MLSKKILIRRYDNKTPQVTLPGSVTYGWFQNLVLEAQEGKFDGCRLEWYDVDCSIASISTNFSEPYAEICFEDRVGWTEG